MTFKYQFSGSLSYQADSYITRAADELLLESLLAGQFCYVLNARQMGKSSLRIQTQKRLQQVGIVFAVVDLQTIGKNLEKETEWYSGIIQCLVNEFNLDNVFDWEKWWWEKSELLQPTQLLNEFLNTIILKAFPGKKIVVLIEEIDSVLDLPFSLDDFFALLRAFHQRAGESGEQQVTFAIFGVSTPSRLVKNPESAPFNIGTNIPLNGFTFEEAKSLSQGLREAADQPEALLAAILDWTAGQPFLTQKLCALAQAERQTAVAAGQEGEAIKQLVKSHILKNWKIQDNPIHLRQIQAYLTQKQEQTSSRLLELYRCMWMGEDIREQLPEEDKINLLLSGLIVEREGQFFINNPIYKNVFNLEWIQQSLARLRPAFYAEAFRLWIASDQKDSSVLLRGEALKRALLWQQEKRLSSDDEAFFKASTAEEQQEANRQLKLQEDENRILDQARHKAIRLLSIASAALLLSLSGAGLASNYALRQSKLAQLSIQKASAAQLATDNAVTAEQQAEQRRQLAELEREAAEEARQGAEGEKAEAEQAAEQANQNLSLAIQELTTAETQLVNADQQVTVARSAAALAGQERLQAQQDAEQAQGEQRVAETAREDALVARQQALDEAFLTKEGITLDESASLAEEQFGYQPSQALRTALQAALDLQQLTQAYDLKGIENYPSAAPLFALQSINHQIWEPPIRLLDDDWKLGDAEFSPDGKTIVTASGDGSTRLWNLSGQLLDRLKGHQENVVKTTFSPDGTHLVTVSVDGSSRLWDLTKRSSVSLFQAGEALTDIQFSADGRSILTVTQTKPGSPKAGTAHLWDVAGNTLAVMEDVLMAELHPNMSRILTASPSGVVRLWDFSGKQRLQLAVNNQVTYGEATANFSANGQRIVTSYGDGTVRLWNLDGQPRNVFRQGDDLSDPVFGGPEGNHLLITLFAQARLWDLTPHRNLPSMQMFAGKEPEPPSEEIWGVSNDLLASLIGHQAPILKSQFSQDGERIITGSEDGTARVWDLTGQAVAALDGHTSAVKDVLLSPDRQHAVTTTRGGIVRLWDLAQRSAPLFRSLIGHKTTVYTAEFSPDGSSIVSSSSDGTIKLWDASSGRQRESWSGHYIYMTAPFSEAPPDDFFDPLPSGEVVHAARFSPDGQTIATVGGSVLKLRDHAGEILKTFTGHEGFIIDAEFSADGRQILTTSHDGTARLFDLDGEDIKVFKGHDAELTQAHFSPDGKFILTASYDRTARLWHKLGYELLVFQGHHGTVMNAEFSPDGKQIATASTDGNVALWNLRGRLTAVLPAPEFGTSPRHQTERDMIDTLFEDTSRTTGMWNARFSPDGKQIVATGNRRRAILWNLADESKIPIDGHQGIILDAKYSPDGQLVATASADKTVRLWDRKGRSILILPAGSPPTSVNFSHDSQKLMATFDNGTAKIWNIQNLEQSIEQGCNWLQTFHDNGNQVPAEELSRCQPSVITAQS